MPCLTILTNLPRAKVPVDFVDRIIPTLAKAVRKSEEKFACLVSPDCFLHISSDSKAPAAIARLESIGNIGPEENKYIVREITKFVEKELKIKPDRFFMTFTDLKPHEVGKCGITASEMDEFRVKFD